MSHYGEVVIMTIAIVILCVTIYIYSTTLIVLRKKHADEMRELKMKLVKLRTGYIELYWRHTDTVRDYRREIEKLEEKMNDDTQLPTACMCTPNVA